jgi:hypothetical protein
LLEGKLWPISGNCHRGSSCGWQFCTAH